MRDLLDTIALYYCNGPETAHEHTVPNRARMLCADLWHACFFTGGDRAAIFEAVRVFLREVARTRHALTIVRIAAARASFLLPELRRHILEPATEAPPASGPRPVQERSAEEDALCL